MAEPFGRPPYASPDSPPRLRIPGGPPSASSRSCPNAVQPHSPNAPESAVGCAPEPLMSPTWSGFRLRGSSWSMPTHADPGVAGASTNSGRPRWVCPTRIEHPSGRVAGRCARFERILSHHSGRRISDTSIRFIDASRKPVSNPRSVRSGKHRMNNRRLLRRSTVCTDRTDQRPRKAGRQPSRTSSWPPQPHGLLVQPPPPLRIAAATSTCSQCGRRHTTPATPGDQAAG